jgi:hypothetical protein
MEGYGFVPSQAQWTMRPEARSSWPCWHGFRRTAERARAGYSIFDSAPDAVLVAKWLFHQEKATSLDLKEVGM